MDKNKWYHPKLKLKLNLNLSLIIHRNTSNDERRTLNRTYKQTQDTQ